MSRYLALAVAIGPLTGIAAATEGLSLTEAMAWYAGIYVTVALQISLPRATICEIHAEKEERAIDQNNTHAS